MGWFIKVHFTSVFFNQPTSWTRYHNNLQSGLTSESLPTKETLQLSMQLLTLSICFAIALQVVVAAPFPGNNQSTPRGSIDDEAKALESKKADLQSRREKYLASEQRELKHHGDHQKKANRLGHTREGESHARRAENHLQRSGRYARHAARCSRQLQRLSGGSDGEQ